MTNRQNSANSVKTLRKNSNVVLCGYIFIMYLDDWTTELSIIAINRKKSLK